MTSLKVRPPAILSELLCPMNFLTATLCWRGQHDVPQYTLFIAEEQQDIRRQSLHQSLAAGGSLAPPEIVASHRSSRRGMPAPSTTRIK